MHRRLMEATAAKTCQCRVHDLAPPSFGKPWICRSGHEFPALTCSRRNVNKANDRSLNVKNEAVKKWSARGQMTIRPDDELMTAQKVLATQ
jgi:hypothetical protein